jgi:hypothetical protein
MDGRRLRLTCASLMILGACAPAAASPWAEVGDNQMRADIEIVAAAGLIDGVTTQWPLPWTSLYRHLRDADLSDASPEARGAAARLLSQAMAATRSGWSAESDIDVTNDPSVVRGFDSLGRGEGQSQTSVSYGSSDFAARVSLGGFTQTFSHGSATKVMPDNSYVAAKLGDEALLYAGWLDHWWGPGWISALALSNNARPMPQVGMQRLQTDASTWPILDWLGPWQGEFFVGLLDGPRLQKNTIYDGLRFTFNPAPGVEIGLARTDEICGQDHPCSPAYYFELNNSPTDVNKTNDEGLIDVKFSHDLWGLPTQLYLQVMNEDTSPFTHSGTSHLFGATVFIPTAGNPLRLTAEYTSSLATTDIFSFGSYIYGFSYTNGGYPDGMRYRGRTLGFSLDDDSTLASLQAAWSDQSGRFYELSLHHATIGAAQTPPGDNIVSTEAVSLDMAEARVTLPFAHFKLDLSARIQDDQPRPQRGATGALEMALKVPL